MRKKTTIILVFLMIAVCGSASTRSLNEKKKIAESYLFAGNTRADRGDLRVLVEKESLSILGNEQYGFVIINNDDQFPAVIGYSQSAFDTMPPALEWYIDAANKSIQASINSGAYYDLIPPSGDFPSSVNSLVKTTWDQGNPYNKFCPGGNGGSSRLYPTGCVATALAQIMNYHQYPERGIGDHQYSFKPADGDGRIISANFGETYYDWGNMLDDYSKVYTDEQADAVATLAESWMQMVYNELNNNRPIYYAGSSESSGGHAFVIDGYNQDGMVHVNWGWGGKSNGMFDISLLNPTGYEFSASQDMILGMCDSTINIPYESQVGARELSFTFYGSTTKRVTISASVIDAAAEKFNGSIACILENNDTTIVLKRKDDITLKPITDGTGFYTSVSLTSINLSNIPDGKFHLYVGSMAADDYKWQLVRPYEGSVYSYIIEKNGDDITWTEDYSDMWAISSTTTGISPVRMNSGPSAKYIYDLRGRKLGTDASALPKGVYIIDGKKVVK